jgi:hypothetical protein
MSPKIPVTRPCAAPCTRIDLADSSRCAALWIGWLVIVCAVVLLAVALPLRTRIAICAVLGVTNACAVRRCVLLRGAHAVRALEWVEQGDIGVLLGAARVAQPATIARGSFRLGGLLVLRLRTSSGMRSVLIDGARQPAREFRRLCRRVDLRRTGGSGRSREPADTIRPKV